jgi:hypothetical protein
MGLLRKQDVISGHPNGEIHTRSTFSASEHFHSDKLHILIMPRSANENRPRLYQLSAIKILLIPTLAMSPGWIFSETLCTYGKNGSRDFRDTQGSKALGTEQDSYIDVPDSQYQSCGSGDFAQYRGKEKTAKKKKKRPIPDSNWCLSEY